MSNRGGSSDILVRLIEYGGLAEWLKAAVSKTVLAVFPLTRVRIPHPPPSGLAGSRRRGPFRCRGSSGGFECRVPVKRAVFV